MANPFSLSDAADLIDVSIQNIWIKGSGDETRQFESFYNVETGVSDYFLKDSSVTGLSYAGRISENAAVTVQSPVQGFKRTYTQVQFGILISFTKFMWVFGIKKRNLEQLTTEARKACSDLRELRCADRLDNAYSTTYTAQDTAGNYAVTTAGGDGKAFIDSAHTREDGGSSWGNRVTDGSTVNMAFDYAALKAAFRTAALITNPRGKPMNVNLDTLVVSRGYAVHNRASEILGAIGRTYIPGSGDRDGPADNPVKGGVPSFKIVPTPWITTNTAFWYMFDSSMKNNRYGLQYKESQPIELEGPNVVFKTAEIQYKATMMFDIGHNDSRNWVGSKNTNAA